MEPIVLTLSLAVAAIPVAWLACALGALVVWARERERSTPLRLIGAATIAAPMAAACGFLGAMFGSMGGNGFIPTAVAVAGEVIGAVVGFRVGYRLFSLSGQPRRVRVSVAVTASVLYWLVAVLVDLFWLFINVMGDCFDVEACRRHQQAAPSQAGLLLIFFLGLYIAVFVGFRWAAGRPAESRASTTS